MTSQLKNLERYQRSTWYFSLTPLGERGNAITSNLSEFATPLT